MNVFMRYELCLIDENDRNILLDVDSFRWIHTNQSTSHSTLNQHTSVVHSTSGEHEHHQAEI